MIRLVSLIVKILYYLITVYQFLPRLLRFSRLAWFFSVSVWRHGFHQSVPFFASLKLEKESRYLEIVRKYGVITTIPLDSILIPYKDHFIVLEPNSEQVVLLDQNLRPVSIFDTVDQIFSFFQDISNDQSN